MKSKVPIIVAVILGVLAILAVRSYVQRVREETEAKLRGKKIVSAKVTIPKGTEINRSMLVPREVPEQFIPPQAVRGSDEVAQIVGRRVRYPIDKGQILLWSDLEEPRMGGLATVIPEDERAYTVRTASGIDTKLIRPNDHVDVIVSFAAPEDVQPAGAALSATWRKGSDMVNVVLLQNVTVLAVGETFGDIPRGGRGGGAITVSVTLPESQLLMFAAQHGELGVVLRREGQIDTVPRDELPRVTFAELEKLIGSLDAERKGRIIEIMRGQDVQEVTVGE
jgi:Flp pilus assembly protein CpaB